MPPVAEFVNADMPESIEAILTTVEVTRNDPFDDPADCSPGNPQQPGDGCLAALLGKVGNSLLERVSEVASRVSPRDLLSLHSFTCRAMNTADGVLQPHGHSCQVEVAPIADTPVFGASCPGTAVSATWNLPGGCNLDDKTRGFEVEATNEEMLDGEKDSE